MSPILDKYQDLQDECSSLRQALKDTARHAAALSAERDSALRDLRLACEARNKAVERAQKLERRVAEEERYARAWAVLEVTANHAKRILESASRLSVSDFRNEMRALIDYAQSTVEDCQSADLSTMKQAAAAFDAAVERFAEEDGEP